MAGSFILHEKGATTTQLSTMKCGQQPLVQNIDVFSELTFPSQTTSSERPAVQMTPQTITEKSPNLTVGCRCRKENSWDGSCHTQIRLLSKNCADRTHQRRLAYHLWPPLLSALNVERAKKWLPSSSSNCDTQGHGDSEQQFLGSSQPFWPITCSCLRILFHRSLDSMESPLSWLWTTWAWWSAFLPSLLNYTNTQFTVESGISRFSAICR